MNWTDLRLRVRALILRKRVERELQEELEFHLDMQTRNSLQHGPDVGDARRRALVHFGGVSKIAEDCRDERRLNVIDNLLQDLRQALRMLRRSPVLTLVAMMTMAFTIGANTAIFSVADAVLFRPFPYGDPAHVYILRMMNRQTGARPTLVPYSYLQTIDDNHSGLSGSGLIEFESVIIPNSEGGERVTTAAVTPNYFQILRARSARGRLLDARDAEQPGRAAVLAYSTWQRRFGGDEGILGRSVTFGGLSVEVVGILPADFVFPFQYGLGGKPEVVTVRPPVARGAPGGAFSPIVRLESGATRAQAQAEIESLASALAAGDPRRTNVTPVLDDVRTVLYPLGAPIMRWLLAATAFVLLIGCANLANMFLVRGHANEPEIGMRMALGASRFRLVRPLILEAIIVSLAGALLALVMTYAGLDVLLARMPRVAYGNAPVGVNLRVAVFSLALGLVASLAFSTAPGWRLFRLDALPLIQRGRHVAVGRRRGLGRPMLVVQVALAIVLVSGALMTARALVSILQVPLGFSPDGVLTVLIEPRGATGRERQEFYVRAMETIARRGDVISVGAAGSIAVDVSAPDEGVRAVNPGQPPVGIVHILPGYFEAAGIALRRGHLPDWSDVRGAADASVIGESAARILFPGRDPIGETFANARGRQFIVVGVVADVRKNPQQEAPALTYAIPADATRRLTLVVRLSGRQDAAVTEIRREISALAPGALVSTEWWSDTMDAWVAYRNPRFQTLVFASLASLALGLVSLGIFGVVAFLVQIRNKEVGIRLALGASSSSIVTLMVFQIIAPVAAGVVIGVAASLWFGRLAEAQLFQLKAHDPLMLGASALTVIVAAILASYAPAYRASRGDPLRSLRQE